MLEQEPGDSDVVAIGRRVACPAARHECPCYTAVAQLLAADIAMARSARTSMAVTLRVGECSQGLSAYFLQPNPSSTICISPVGLRRRGEPFLFIP